jgi:hypothetical protein
MTWLFFFGAHKHIAQDALGLLCIMTWLNVEEFVVIIIFVLFSELKAHIGVLSLRSKEGYYCNKVLI